MFKKLFYPLAHIVFPFRLFTWDHACHEMVAERILNGMTPGRAGTWRVLLPAMKDM